MPENPSNLFPFLQKITGDKIKVIFIIQDPIETTPLVSYFLKELSNYYKKSYEEIKKERSNLLEDWSQKGIVFYSINQTYQKDFLFNSHYEYWNEFSRYFLKSLNINLFDPFDGKKCVFVFLGDVAQRFQDEIDLHPLISCPMPGTSAYSNEIRFKNFAIFEKINEKLEEKINW